LRTLANGLGLEELADDIGGDLEGHAELSEEADAVFSAQQTVLGNIMVVSALLLGFIVTGTLLSIGLTGRDNFGIGELIHFFKWSSLAAMFAFVSLITAFLTSVSAAHRLLTRGRGEGARLLTSGSTLRRILAEASLYLSMFFFLVSLKYYIWMVYSGPDICATYRGASSFCGRTGADLYQAAAPECNPKCPQLQRGGKLERECTRKDDRMECLCIEVCKLQWEKPYNWTNSVTGPHPGVALHNYHFFAYRPLKPIPKPAREKVITASASLMCNHGALEAEKESCFRSLSARECTVPFLAWQKSEECMDNAIEDAHECAKVCEWTRGYPPREALKDMTDWAFIPLGTALIVLTLGRIIVISIRGCAAIAKPTSRVRKLVQSALLANSDDESNSGDDRAP